MRCVRYWLCGLVLMTGCAGVDPLPTEVHVPLPAVAVAQQDHPALAAGIWRVAPFTAAGPYLERAIVYSDDDGVTLQQHPHQFWVDAPARLCRDGLLEFLRGAGVGQRVVATADAAATLEVRGRLLAFDRLLGADGSTARLALELELVDTGTRQVRLSRRYEERQPAADNNAGGVASAAATALDRLYRRFLADAATGVAR